MQAWEDAGYPTEGTGTFMPGIERISASALKAKLDAKANIAIVDSRHQEYYDESHIKGAISLVLHDMKAPYPRFDTYDEIVTYCT